VLNVVGIQSLILTAASLFVFTDSA